MDIWVKILLTVISQLLVILIIYGIMRIYRNDDSEDKYWYFYGLLILLMTYTIITGIIWGVLK